jgi:hypothetical protein
MCSVSAKLDPTAKLFAAFAAFQRAEDAADWGLFAITFVATRVAAAGQVLS